MNIYIHMFIYVYVYYIYIHIYFYVYSCLHASSPFLNSLAEDRGVELGGLGVSGSQRSRGPRETP